MHKIMFTVITQSLSPLTVDFDLYGFLGFVAFIALIALETFIALREFGGLRRQQR
jgi:hypothetical protein